MKKTIKKGDVVSIDGLSLKIESISGTSASGITADGDPVRYHLRTHNGVTAAGRTERHAEIALRRKIFENTPEDERIRDFVKRYPPDAFCTVEEWTDAFQKLTGACSIGIYRFIRERGYKKTDRYTTLDFLEAVDGVYSGDLITKVKNNYKKEEV